MPPPIVLPWPLPKLVTSGTSTLALPAAEFQFHVDAGHQGAIQLLEEAVGRALRTLAVAARKCGGGGNGNATHATLTELSVRIASTAPPLLVAGVNESYTLEVCDGPTPTAVLAAATPWGALHGLETFLQIVTCAPALALPGAPWAIADAPRFAHRGLLLDTSRHLLPVPALLRSLPPLMGDARPSVRM